MIQIRDAIISLAVFQQNFACDLHACRGKCCESGDSGAPLEESEKSLLKRDYAVFKKYMQGAGVEAVEEGGFYYLDEDGEYVTTLIKGKECAYSYKEGDTFLCAIEKAWHNQEIAFRKPLSCHLYPIRIKQFASFQAVNYDEWEVCTAACQKGDKQQIPLIEHLKDALLRKFGQTFFDEMKIALRAVRQESI